jgi:hypothetical protein
VIIRQQQMDALRDSSVESFRKRMAQHLGILFPGYCKALEAAELRGAIDFSIQKAASHAFRAEMTVCPYIDLMFLLGSGFDTDPQLPRAREILDPTPDDEFGRMQRLYGRAALLWCLRDGQGLGLDGRSSAHSTARAAQRFPRRPGLWPAVTRWKDTASG